MAPSRGGTRSFLSADHIETDRPNYPAAGKLRIYLTKIASSTASTYLAWMVMG